MLEHNHCGRAPSYISSRKHTLCCTRIFSKLTCTHSSAADRTTAVDGISRRHRCRCIPSRMVTALRSATTTAEIGRNPNRATSAANDIRERTRSMARAAGNVQGCCSTTARVVDKSLDPRKKLEHGMLPNHDHAKTLWRPPALRSSLIVYKLL